VEGARRPVLSDAEGDACFGKAELPGFREPQAGKEVLMKEKYTRAQPGHWHSPSRRDTDNRKTWR